jgi:hypothetical protein
VLEPGERIVFLPQRSASGKIAYLALMKGRRIEDWPQLQKIIQGLTAAAA